MFLRSFAVLSCLTAALLTVGCSADANDEEATTDDQGEQSADMVAAHRFHYKPVNAEVVWKPGCGVAMPDGHHCEMGLFVRYTRLYIDLKVTQTATFDAATNTLTVKLDTWSNSSTHPLTMVAMMPEEQRVEDIGGSPMGMCFKARVVDWRGRELSHTEVYAVPAP
jgi:hypothetical protein